MTPQDAIFLLSVPRKHGGEALEYPLSHALELEGLIEPPVPKVNRAGDGGSHGFKLGDRVRFLHGQIAGRHGELKAPYRCGTCCAPGWTVDVEGCGGIPYMVPESSMRPFSSVMLSSEEAFLAEQIRKHPGETAHLILRLATAGRHLNLQGVEAALVEFEKEVCHVRIP